MVDAATIRPAFEYSSAAVDSLGVPLWVPLENTVGVFRLRVPGDAVPDTPATPEAKPERSAVGLTP